MRYIATSIALLCGLSMLAQSVTVVTKDGSSHRFNADYISRIAIEDVNNDIPRANFEYAKIHPYDGGNVTLSLADYTSNIRVDLDMYGSQGATYLEPGTYSIARNKKPFTIDPSTRYTSVVYKGETRNISDGNIVVDISDHKYHLSLYLEFTDNGTLVGEYSGNLTGYSPWVEFEANSAWFDATPLPPGNMGITFRSADDLYRINMLFNTPVDASTLPVGSYVYSDQDKLFTIGQGSNVSDSMGNVLPLCQGSSVSVSVDAEGVYTVMMKLLVADGREFNVRFKGEIENTPQQSLSLPAMRQRVETSAICYDAFKLFKYCITVETRTGENVMFRFDDHPVGRIVGNSVELRVPTTGEVVQIPVSDILAISLQREEYDGIEQTNYSHPSVRFSLTDNTLSITGLKGHAPVVITSMSGINVVNESADSEGTFNISLKHFAAGIYAVRAGDASFRILHQ